jgi:hypothetical protein
VHQVGFTIEINLLPAKALLKITKNVEAFFPFSPVSPISLLHACVRQ